MDPCPLLVEIILLFNIVPIALKDSNNNHSKTTTAVTIHNNNNKDRPFKVTTTMKVGNNDNHTEIGLHPMTETTLTTDLTMTIGIDQIQTTEN